MWSGVPTTGNKEIDSEEHIFPECIGGRDTLPVGDVSKEWNNRLSWLDNILKKGHPAMMFAYQVDPTITGKKTSNKARKKRRKEEKKSISNITGVTRIERDLESRQTNLLNASFEGFDNDFCRSIHKCIANVICFHEGSRYVRDNFLELIDFVKNGTNPGAWSYAVSFADPFIGLCIVPQCIKLAYSLDKQLQQQCVWVCFVHTSGIWIAVSQPNALNKEIIEEFSNSILADTPLVKKIEEAGADFRRLFGMEWASNRKFIGEFKFIWIKKQIEGKPNPEDAFYLLTKCKLCGQINPTGIMITKGMILNGNHNRATGMPKNSWNYYSIKDLERRGLHTQKWDPRKLEKRIHTQGIDVPLENDVRKLNITNCKCTCINCGNTIKYDANDCFL